MSELEDSFTRLLGRQPTDSERQNLYRVRDALGFRKNDSLWLVLMALEYYQGQYERIPQAIQQTARETLAGFKAAADAQAKASIGAAKADLARAVATTADRVAHEVAVQQKAQWIAICTAVVAVCLGGMTWFAHQQGHRAGFSRGYGIGLQQAQDEKAAAAWANTPEGQLAYRFAKKGSLPRLARCDKPGWSREDGVCFVRTAPNGNIYGWYLP